jgi:hypothetical protein
MARQKDRRSGARQPREPLHRRIVIGAEIEAYSISTDDYRIGRKLTRPRPGLSESGEKFARDASIGNEYNSRPFATVRESLFLLKSGLRKYLRGFYRGALYKEARRIPLLVGGWTDRVAGTHLHLSVLDQPLRQEDARSLAMHIHDHIPLLIAIGANSPIWNRKLTTHASMRVLRGSDTYFKPIRRGQLPGGAEREMVFSRGRKTKPATLEVRILDSNLPEFIVAALCVLKAVALRWLRGGSATNRLSYDRYLRARSEAAALGMRCRLFWKDDELTAGRYFDRFLWEHREELDLMDIPDDTYETFRLLKRGYNGARIIQLAVRSAQDEHPQTWQRRFAKRYSHGLHRLLSGNSLRDFAGSLAIQLPSTDRVWLGRKGASLDE